jgi:DNA polymerase alpha subunit B
VAAGPFSYNEDLNYKPLKELIKVIKDEEMDLVILIGPFIDESNEVIKTNNLGKSYDDLFKDVLNIFKELNCKVILIPSIEDVHHDFTFPQMPFDIKDEKISSLPNPSIFTINQNLSIGVSSVKTSNKFAQTCCESNKYH